MKLKEIIPKTIDDEIREREQALDFIPKEILRLEFQIEELKEHFKAHQSVLEELIQQKQQDLVKAIEEVNRS